jgi:hypothetical protein
MRGIPGSTLGGRLAGDWLSPPWRMTIVTIAEAHEIAPAVHKRANLDRSMRCDTANSSKRNDHTGDEILHHETGSSHEGVFLPLGVIR